MQDALEKKPEKKASVKYGTVKIRCNCQNAFQDKTYGIGVRVHNRCKGKTADPVARCTVCETVRAASGGGNAS